MIRCRRSSAPRYYTYKPEPMRLVAVDRFADPVVTGAVADVSTAPMSASSRQRCSAATSPKRKCHGDLRRRQGVGRPTMAMAEQTACLGVGQRDERQRQGGTCGAGRCRLRRSRSGRLRRAGCRPVERRAQSGRSRPCVDAVRASAVGQGSGLCAGHRARPRSIRTRSPATTISSARTSARPGAEAHQHEPGCRGLPE